MILNLALFLKNNSINKYQRTDLFNDETISITQVIQDVQEISKIFTNFTKTFTHEGEMFVVNSIGWLYMCFPFLKINRHLLCFKDEYLTFARLQEPNF